MLTTGSSARLGGLRLADVGLASAAPRRDAPLGQPLTPEVVARLDQALRARPIEDLPSAYARPVYDVLLAHGFDRADLLSLAASLVDLVTSDVIRPPR